MPIRGRVTIRWLFLRTNSGLTRTAALRDGSQIRGSLALASQREVAETLLAVTHLGLVETQRSPTT
jgi:hypothetical protein